MSKGDRPVDARVWTKARSPAHGFCDDEPTRRMLRSRPPRQALQWTEHHLGGRVASTRALRGGTSSAVHLVTLDNPDGARRHAVLRRYVPPDVNAEEPDLAVREATALRFVEPIEVPTPRPLAVDPSGDDAGAPALLMTQLPGRVDWWPTDGEGWLRRLAELVPKIHSAPPPPPRALPPYAPYPQTSYDPPAWARHPRAWERAVEIAFDPAPDLPGILIQRDFHPGNVLWRRGIVSGVVDWQAASFGPAAVDIGHFRVNLLTFGRPVADRFTRLWEQASGLTYHPWAEVVTIVDFLDDLRSDWGSERDLVEELLIEAVAELGRTP